MKFFSLLLIFSSIFSATFQKKVVDQFFDGTDQKNNWAVLVMTEGVWHEHADLGNILALHYHLTKLGVPASQIIVMLSFEHACNARNPFPATSKYLDDDFYWKGLEVTTMRLYAKTMAELKIDYTGDDVTVKKLYALLTNRVPPWSKRLLSNEKSNVLVYLAGHGGGGRMPMRSGGYLGIRDLHLANAFEEMWLSNRYRELLLIVNSCGSASLYSELYSPNVFAITSSASNEKPNRMIITGKVTFDSLIDRWMLELTKFLITVETNQSRSFKDMINFLSYDRVESTTSVRSDLYPKKMGDVPLIDFFGSKRQINFLSGIYLGNSRDEFKFKKEKSDRKKSAIDDNKIYKSSNLLPWSAFSMKYK